MDTREKILDVEEAARQLAEGRWVVVPGVFDPLTAAQARRLAAAREHGSRLMAVVLSQREELLSAEARAALVAGLREVSAVVVCDSKEWTELRGRLGASDLIDDERGEAARSAEFIRFVWGRQRSQA